MILLPVACSLCGLPACRQNSAGDPDACSGEQSLVTINISEFQEAPRYRR
jgi:hypothetical protein